MSHSRQFKALWEFFARYYPEVEARRSEDLSPAQKTALTNLASGKSDPAAREKLIPFLRSNRHALTFLADQIKLSRPGRLLASGPYRSQARSKDD
jgi:hypothetical protein